MDGECDAVYERVRDADGHDGEGPEGDALAGYELVEVGVVEEAMLFELTFDVGESELGSIDGDVELGEYPRETTDVVFVAVGQKYGANHLAVFSQITDVGYNNVDAQQLFFGKHQTGVDDDNVILPAEGHAVHTELAEAAQRNQLNLSCAINLQF